VGCAEQVPLVQDGHPSRSRQYFERCYIQGDVDFIFGSYRCWFEDCTLFMNQRGGWYTAANTHASQPWGFVFRRCRLTGACAEGKAFLGRPWRAGSAAVFLSCDMDAHVAPEGFTDWDETRVITARYGEWGTTGVRADLSFRDPREKRLTDAEAAALTPAAVLSGTDGWRPDLG
jgi:pectinesterase